MKKKEKEKAMMKKQKEMKKKEKTKMKEEKRDGGTHKYHSDDDRLPL